MYLLYIYVYGSVCLCKFHCFFIIILSALFYSFYLYIDVLKYIYIIVAIINHIQFVSLSVWIKVVTGL